MMTANNGSGGLASRVCVRTLLEEESDRIGDQNDREANEV